ncbi:MAG: hypothetical protein FD167_2909 [bacterium]|nr:MAG: hypothetical protein FD167_2909 [bacterium]
MEKVALESICGNLTIGQTIQVRTAIGRLLQGEFLGYEGTGITGALLLSNSGNTFCLSFDQIDRIFITDDDNIEDTLSPSVLK